MKPLSRRRIRGVMLHNLYDMWHSPVRWMELAYWPLIEMVLWGFITTFLAQADADVPGGVRLLLGAVVLWQLVFRSSIEVSWAFLIDVWDRNILNVAASPVTPLEHFLGSLVFAIVRVITAAAVLVGLAWVFFDYSLLDAGRVLPLALLGLMGMGWALALFIRTLILRFGHNAEIMAWSLPFLLQPVSAVFYPVDVLPAWLQATAAAVPASHLFEALREFLDSGTLLLGQLGAGLGLDLVYLGLGAVYATRTYHTVRVKGLLGRPGY